jgi:hypothetical protein
MLSHILNDSCFCITTNIWKPINTTLQTTQAVSTHLQSLQQSQHSRRERRSRRHVKASCKYQSPNTHPELPEFSYTDAHKCYSISPNYYKLQWHTKLSGTEGTWYNEMKNTTLKNFSKRGHFPHSTHSSGMTQHSILLISWKKAKNTFHIREKIIISWKSPSDRPSTVSEQTSWKSNLVTFCSPALNHCTFFSEEIWLSSTTFHSLAGHQSEDCFAAAVMNYWYMGYP